MMISYISAYFLGALSGFLASIPLGPIGILCIQRTLSSTKLNGFVSGMGAAAADTIFATFALFCVTYINAFLEKYDFWVQVFGGIILIIFGFNTFRKRTPHPNRINKKSQSSSNYISSFLSVLILTLANPAYFLVYTMIFAALGMGGASYSLGADLLLLLGVYTGTNLWWFVLTTTIDKFRGKFTYRRLVYTNKIAGGAIMCFGIWGIIKVVIDLLDIVIKLMPIPIGL